MTEIDVRATLKEKLDLDFRPYKILGACNPPLAHKALEAEDKIGLMLPCNVIVQRTAEGKTEVAAVDPVASMQAVDNDALRPIAEDVRAASVVSSPIRIHPKLADRSASHFAHP